MISTIQNTDLNAIRMFEKIRTHGITPILDLDEVLFCAKHRQKIYTALDVESGNCQPDQVGQLDLNHYRSETTAEQVAKDKNLPFLRLVHMLNDTNHIYHVATARVACNHTRRLLINRGVLPSTLIARNGDNDHRRDHVLKCEGIIKHFGIDGLNRFMLIDDNLANCKAVKGLGANSVQVIM